MSFNRSYVNKKNGAPILAAQLTSENYDRVVNWTQGQLVEEQDALTHDVVSFGVNIKTPDGRKRISEGDWVVFYKGDFFACKDSVFQTTYRPSEW